MVERQMTNMGKVTTCQSLICVKNISLHPGPPPVRCIAPDFLGLTSSVNSVATDPSKLPWKIISAISEDQFLKTDNITMHTHWTKCCF